MIDSYLWCNNQYICKDDTEDIVCLANKLGNLAMRCPFIVSSDVPVVDCPDYQPKEKSGE